MTLARSRSPPPRAAAGRMPLFVANCCCCLVALLLLGTTSSAYAAAMAEAKDISTEAVAAAAAASSSSSFFLLSGDGDWKLPSGFRWRTPLSDEEADRRARVRDLVSADNEFLNDLTSWMLPDGLRAAMPRFALSWFRNWVLGNLVYLVGCSVWAYYIYFVFGNYFFASGNMPSLDSILEQVRVAMTSLPFYSLLPTVTELIVESGWSRVYPRVDDVGLLSFGLFFVLYMACVEFGVYWVHRKLHEVEWAYRLLHHDHHKYNKEHTLSPFAGLAFHPMDGVLQALPYTLTLFIVPMHYLTHLMLLFLTGLWTMNIHDCVDGKVEPIMGSGYHTIHHTTYKDNYGHYFIYMDWLFGTLMTPEDFQARRRGAKKAA